MMYKNWEVAAAILVDEDRMIHFKEMTGLVQEAQLSKLGGESPSQSMRTILGSQSPGPEYFERHPKGYYSIKESKKNVTELLEVKQAYQRYLSRLENENKVVTVSSTSENDLYKLEEQNTKYAERGNSNPDRQRIEIERIIRDTKLAEAIKNHVGNTCQLCGEHIILTNGKLYSEAHHIIPLGKPYNGPDKEDNIIILCPNCHVKCDYRAIPIDQESIKNNHGISEESIGFHNELHYRNTKFTKE